MAAFVLTRAGANVLMLEAGVDWDPRRDSMMFAWSYDSPRRGAATPQRQFGEFNAGIGGWTLDGEPYTTAPGHQFDWFRTRMLGGRTNHWGRISLRFGPDDFRRRSLDGLGDDWPITYEDVRPYYDKVKNDYRRFYGATVGFSGRGEMIPNADTYCELDPRVVDRWGIPVLRFHFKWSDYEYRQVRHMQETFRAIIHEMGGTPLDPMPTREEGYGIATGGRIIHELGVTRMGNDPQTSVLNRYCQAHEVKNLFVADGGPFVSQPDKNPTWTILALAMRTSEYIAAERKKGNL